jgi:diaminopimelate epimerase
MIRLPYNLQPSGPPLSRLCDTDTIMRFTKMHGLGNDYVYINGFDPSDAPDNPSSLAKELSDRHFGVGGDGLILLLPAEDGVDAHCRMRMFNIDGSEGEMCGNGIRCVCKLAHDSGVVPDNPMKIQTGNGVLTLDYTLDKDGRVDCVTVDMGEPQLDPAQVPIDVAGMTATDQPQTFEFSIDEIDERFTGTFCSTGNPHVSIYVDDVSSVNLTRLGPLLERHPLFPARMNVHFVEVISSNEVKVRHWERGSGITLACGTGASAVCVAGVLTGRTQRKITAHLPGGALTLEWKVSDNHVYMTGPATEVFTGDWPG